MTRTEVLTSTKWAKLMQLPPAARAFRFFVAGENSETLFDGWETAVATVDDNSVATMPVAGDIIVCTLTNAPPTPAPNGVPQTFLYLTPSE